VGITARREQTSRKNVTEDQPNYDNGSGFAVAKKRFNSYSMNATLALDATRQPS
jgi:hypothetical protein